MHELSLIHGLMRQLQKLAQAHGADRVTAVKVKVGALAHCSPEHFREHFAQASRGTVAEGARVDVELALDEFDPQAQDIILDEFEISHAH
jgi:hydrogenase nickel incorporation protein HypA/HybF